MQGVNPGTSCAAVLSASPFFLGTIRQEDWAAGSKVFFHWVRRQAVGELRLLHDCRGNYSYWRPSDAHSTLAREQHDILGNIARRG